MKGKHISSRNKRNGGPGKPVLERYQRFRFRDFSLVEDDARAFQLIHALANDAGNYAAAEAKARGLETAYLRGNKLIKVSAKGETVALAPKRYRASFYVKYKPGTILNALKK